ncbi:hypothetical protein BJX68DRAFT_145354 [Aspergillus pseudodeflectus]|uniref:Uncharacterized protein n=1 Tax=Aspergillus pseudodeflectus TaxID=176178 RepID=A0ABR4L4F4_9EURO
MVFGEKRQGRPTIFPSIDPKPPRDEYARDQRPFKSNLAEYRIVSFGEFFFAFPAQPQFSRHTRGGGWSRHLGKSAALRSFCRMRIADWQNSQAASPSTQPQPALSASSFFAAALKAIISPLYHTSSSILSSLCLSRHSSAAHSLLYHQHFCYLP